jgi:hypothetical protein
MPIAILTHKGRVNPESVWLTPLEARRRPRSPRTTARARNILIAVVAVRVPGIRIA